VWLDNHPFSFIIKTEGGLRFALEEKGWLDTTLSFIIKTEGGLRFALEEKGWLDTTLSFIIKTEGGLRFAPPPRGPPISRLPDGKRIKKRTIGDATQA
jgi:hypothetical protein